ncbi:MAG: hypothetical protein KGV56_05540 [Gammaproteobacteria bacterium]|nr:hypothetical protein [Gammaproteobacteria bacterium]
MKLIDNVKHAHKMWSVWAITFLSAIPIIEQNFHYFSAIIPEQYHSWIMAGFGLCGIALRLIKQDNVNAQSD